MIKLKIGWETKLEEWYNKKNKSFAGITLRTRIKELNKMISRGEAVILDSDEYAQTEKGEIC